MSPTSPRHRDRWRHGFCFRFRFGLGLWLWGRNLGGLLGLIRLIVLGLGGSLLTCSLAVTGCLAPTAWTRATSAAFSGAAFDASHTRAGLTIRVGALIRACIYGYICRRHRCNLIRTGL